jgi:hypothetical protein
MVHRLQNHRDSIPEPPAPANGPWNPSSDTLALLFNLRRPLTRTFRRPLRLPHRRNQSDRPFLLPNFLDPDRPDVVRNLQRSNKPINISGPKLPTHSQPAGSRIPNNQLPRVISVECRGRLLQRLPMKLERPRLGLHRRPGQPVRQLLRRHPNNRHLVPGDTPLVPGSKHRFMRPRGFVQPSNLPPGCGYERTYATPKVGRRDGAYDDARQEDRGRHKEGSSGYVGYGFHNRQRRRRANDPS